MKKRMLLLTWMLPVLGIALVVLLKSQAQQSPAEREGQSPAAKSPSAPLSQYKLSGPYTHKNLTIFLIHGEDQLKGKIYLTLQEAIAQKKVIVHETRNVNKLAIENVSAEEVYIQSGEIVKGGEQDRTLAFDLIVPPHSGRMPIDAFCVEQGRWSQRGTELAVGFSASEKMLSSKDLKVAAKHKGSQQEVWNNVTVVQDKLARNIGSASASGAGGGTDAGNGPVAVPATLPPATARLSGGILAPASPTSLQLALENKQVKEMADEYLKQLLPIINDKPDVIGYAFAINGQLNSADLYGSSALFRKLWKKMLEASAVEAISEFDPNQQFAEVTEEAVREAFSEAEKGTSSEREVSRRVKLITRESGKYLFFETRDQQRQNAWIHRNYLVK